MLYVLAFDECVMLTLNFMFRSKLSSVKAIELQILHRYEPTCFPCSSGVKIYYFVNHFLQIRSSRQDKRLSTIG